LISKLCRSGEEVIALGQQARNERRSRCRSKDEIARVDAAGVEQDDCEVRLPAIGAVAVTERTVRHDDAFEALLRQDRSSTVDNILIHQIGGQQQLAGADPVECLVARLEYVADSRVVAFRAEFDAAVFAREVREHLGLRTWHRFIDLAAILPAVFPGTENDTLDDWLIHFGLPPITRHHAIADAYATAQLLMIVFEAARRLDIETLGDLRDVEHAQRWLGRRR